MINDPYSTTPCKDYQIQDIKRVISNYKAIFGVGDRSQISYIDKKNTQCLSLEPGTADIPPFAHPLRLGDEKTRKEDVQYIVDMRNCLRLNRDGESVVSDQLAHGINSLRCRLQAIWDLEDPDLLMNTGLFQVTIFSRWIAQLIVQRFGLDPEGQARVTALAAFHYLCMYREAPVSDEMEYEETLKMATIINRATMIPADMVLSLIENLQATSTANDFISILKEHGGSVRLEQLNLGLLYTVTGGSWFGSNARELLAVALEHPPTFLAVLYTALNERGYRNSGLGKLVIQYDKHDAAKSFNINLVNLLAH